MIYKYLPATDASLEMFRASQVPLVHSSAVADPFDFRPLIVEGAPKSEDRERFSSAMAAWGFHDLEKAEPHDEYFDAIATGQPDFTELIAKTYFSNFCRDATNSVQWARFAGGMDGFCIGIEERAILDRGGADILWAVEYTCVRPVVDAFLYSLAYDQYEFHHLAIEQEGDDPTYRIAIDDAFELSERIWRAAFVTKSCDWESEQEIRLLVHDFDGRLPSEQLHRCYFSRSSSVRLVIGNRMDPNFRDELLAIARDVYKNFRIKVASPSASEMAIELKYL